MVFHIVAKRFCIVIMCLCLFHILLLNVELPGQQCQSFMERTGFSQFLTETENTEKADYTQKLDQKYLAVAFEQEYGYGLLGGGISIESKADIITYRKNRQQWNKS